MKHSYAVVSENNCWNQAIALGRFLISKVSFLVKKYSEVHFTTPVEEAQQIQAQAEPETHLPFFLGGGKQ